MALTVEAPFYFDNYWERVDFFMLPYIWVYVDLTFGGGGHSKEILKHLSPKGKLFSFDQDEDAKANIPAGETRLTFIPHNFRYIKNYLKLYGITQVDGILGDLGVSSHQFDKG